MKTVIILIGFFIFSYSYSQKNNNTYLYFDNENIEYISFEVGDGSISNERKYIKELKKNGDIYFYIEKELFVFEKNKTIDTCKIDFLKGKKLISLKELKNKLPSKYIYYPFEYYTNLILIEAFNESIILCYDVKWSYYIE